MIKAYVPKKKKEVYGPTKENSNKISDNVMQMAVERFQSSPAVSERKKSLEADRAKYVADNTPFLGEGTFTVNGGDLSYSKKGLSPSKNVTAGQGTAPATVSNYTPVQNPEQVLLAGMKNKVSAQELMPVWNQYWSQVEDNVKNDPSLAPYMYNQTYRDWITYTGQDSDIGEQIRSAISRGADPREVEMLLNKRTYKATENPYLNEYAYDDVYEMARKYIENNQDKYTDNYKDKISERMARRDKPFSYSVADDPLYQQYLQQAREQGRMAMEDTLSDVAIGAGGMNSYAIAAAQGMNNNYMQRVNDVIPELYQLAYNKYLNEQNREAEDINMLMALENQDYNRWASERARDDELGNMAYERMLYDDQLKYQREQDAYNKEMTEREWDYNMKNDDFNKALSFAQLGIIDDGLIAGSGIPKEVFEQVKNIAIANANKKSGGVSDGETKKTGVTGQKAVELLKEGFDTAGIRQAACGYLGCTEEELEAAFPHLKKEDDGPGGDKRTITESLKGVADYLVDVGNGGFVQGVGWVNGVKLEEMVLNDEVVLKEDDNGNKYFVRK